MFFLLFLAFFFGSWLGDLFLPFLFRDVFPVAFLTFSALIQRFGFFSRTLATLVEGLLWFSLSMPIWSGCSACFAPTLEPGNASCWLISTFKCIAVFNDLYKPCLEINSDVMLWHSRFKAMQFCFNCLSSSLFSDKIWKRMKNLDQVWSCGKVQRKQY